MPKVYGYLLTILLEFANRREWMEAGGLDGISSRDLHDIHHYLIQPSTVQEGASTVDRRSAREGKER